MKVYLAMMFLMQGQWIDGAALDGWAPREQPSMEVCLDRARAAMRFAPPQGAEWLVAHCLEISADRLRKDPPLVGMQLAALPTRD